MEACGTIANATLRSRRKHRAPRDERTERNHQRHPPPSRISRAGDHGAPREPDESRDGNDEKSWTVREVRLPPVCEIASDGHHHKAEEKHVPPRWAPGER